ncbi:hypothetical protein EB796_013329 [Bugula neritina]|uniref:Uncharacterized protein n=1 Tax=Bugula neritina TaxID=10212 RepID=A0A7J7JQZ1_BUGNE|nr:hypothetical protein EB796_015627 [Bugula neritina]KAF6028365.1 hypothetical protein EB796_013329 [Bugula neritina]
MSNLNGAGLLGNLLNPGGFGSTGELVQQLALLNWLKKGDDSSKKTLEQVTQFRVASDLWSRVNNQSQIDAAQAKTILAISEYVKKNPKASKAELTKFISNEITAFAATVDAL